MAGFTLIEMVVALALLMMIAVGLFEGLRFAQRTYAKTVVQAEGTWQLFTAQRWLRGVLESAYPQDAMDVGGRSPHGVEGTQDEIQVIAPAPASQAGGGFFLYRIATRPRLQGGLDVVVSWEPELSGSVNHRDQRSEILVENVRAVEWSYYRDGIWSPSWQAQRNLPQLIRVRVTFSPDDPRRWPELLAVPRITDDANCAFDVVAQRCREPA